MPKNRPASEAKGGPLPDQDTCPRLPGGRLDIPIGTMLQITPADTGRTFTSEFVGSLGLDWLLARLPESGPGHLGSQVRATVRFPHRCGLCGFETVLAGAVAEPVPLLAMAFPGEVGNVELRRTPRVPCFLPSRVNCDGAERNSLITNLSEEGCRLVLQPGDTMAPDQCLPGAGLACNFRLFDFLDAVFAPGLVRYARLLAGRLSLGVQFASLDKRDKVKIGHYVEQVRTLHEGA